MEEGIQIRISGNKACAWKKHCTGHMNEIKLCWNSLLHIPYRQSSFEKRDSSCHSSHMHCYFSSRIKIFSQTYNYFKLLCILTSDLAIESGSAGRSPYSELWLTIESGLSAKHQQKYNTRLGNPSMILAASSSESSRARNLNCNLKTVRFVTRTAAGNSVTGPTGRVGAGQVPDGHPTWSALNL